MIPKILNFVWFGNNIPKYAFYAMFKFHEMNPTFRINFIHKTIQEINDLNDDILKYSMDLLNETLSLDINKDKKIIYFQKYNLFFPRTKMLINILTDIYKREFIYQNGGIYLDCDTFPINPFDDELLSKNNFMVYHSDLKYYDNFFFGSISGEYCKDRECTEHLYYKNINFKKYYNIKNDFFNLKLDNLNLQGILDENKDIKYYILHMCDYTWGPNSDRVQRTKYDI